MSFAIQTSFSKTYQYGRYVSAGRVGMNIGSFSVDHNSISQPMSNTRTDARVNGDFMGTISNMGYYLYSFCRYI